MTVKAEVNKVRFATVPVYFQIIKSTPITSEIKFSSRYYKVVVSDDLKKGDKIFDLPILPPNAAQHVVYNISGINHYFEIHGHFGTITLKRDFKELQLREKASKKFAFTVIARLRGSSTIAASAIINVIVIPAFSGDIFNHLVEKTDKTSIMNDRKSVQKSTRSEFAFHRFFRQLSPTAENISKAGRKFDKVIRSLRESVVDGFTGNKVFIHVFHSILRCNFHQEFINYQ